MCYLREVHLYRGTPVVIKPDMSLKERKSESMLLKERWSLIQSGVPREVIKIRGSRLLVRNKLHGQVTPTSRSVVTTHVLM